MAFRFAAVLGGIALELRRAVEVRPIVTTTAGGRDPTPQTRHTPSTRDGIGDCVVCDVSYDCTSAGSSGSRGWSFALRRTCTDANIRDDLRRSAVRRERVLRWRAGAPSRAAARRLRRDGES